MRNYISCSFLFLFTVTCTLLSSEENFLLINGETDQTVLELGPHVDERISPCSTFKIPLSLMGYDAGILKDESNPVWDFQEGYDDWIEAWRTPQTPKSWMQYSCVWFSKVLSIELGLDRMQSYVDSFAYGNQDISGGVAAPGPTQVAWINSSLKISLREQVDFIQKMVHGRLPVLPSAVEMTKSILFKEESPDGWKLYGKTGSSGSYETKDGTTLQHGWFVGWIQKDQQFFPFAYFIREPKIDLNQRIPRVKELLSASGIMEIGS